MNKWIHGKIDLELDRLLEKMENADRNFDHNAWIKFMGTKEYARMIREDARRLARQGKIEPLRRLSQQGDLWQLCCCPSLSSVGRLVSLSAVRIEVHVVPVARTLPLAIACLLTTG
jgi:hypothetical protein